MIANDPTIGILLFIIGFGLGWAGHVVFAFFPQSKVMTPSYFGAKGLTSKDFTLFSSGNSGQNAPPSKTTPPPVPPPIPK